MVNLGRASWSGKVPSPRLPGSWEYPTRPGGRWGAKQAEEGGKGRRSPGTESPPAAVLRWMWLERWGPYPITGVQLLFTGLWGKSERRRVDAGASSRPREGTWVGGGEKVIKHPSLGTGKQPRLAEIAGK